MAETYTTRDGDTVDQIAFDRYGRHAGTTELIYAANRGLAALGPILEAGVEIILPDLPAADPVAPAAPVRLFD